MRTSAGIGSEERRASAPARARRACRRAGASVVAGLTLVGWIASASRSWACSTCGCTLSSDWAAQGFAAGSGFRLDLRFDDFTQGDLRAGTRSVNRSAIPLPADREIQQKTINRNVTVSLDYSPDAAWGINLQVPFFARYHTTIAPGDTAISTSDFNRVGDARLIGRYQGFSPDHTTGVELGFKLATGAFDEPFVAGPQAGTPLDRGLQPGTGTTDLVIGAYHYGALGASWSYFVQALAQEPLGRRRGFEPGVGLNVNLGVRGPANRAVVPQLQLNFRAEGRESGPEADADNSGATLAYLGLGVTVRLARNVAAFAFVQVPIYQNVDGYQLEPRYTASLGLHVQL